MKKYQKKIQKSNLRLKIPYFQSESQRKRTDRKSILFGSKRVMALVAIVILASVFGGLAILQKSRDSSAAATVVRDNTSFTCDWNSSSGMLVEGCSPGISYLGGSGPGGDKIIRSALVDGMSNASSGVPNERVDAQGGSVPLNSVRWAAGWQRITDVPSNIPETSGWRWHLMGFWEIHGRTAEQAIIQPEIWKQNGQVRYRMNANAGYNSHRYFDIGPVTLGKWEYWEVGVNYRNDSSGWIRVYKNGQLVSSVNGVVTSETGSGYWKSANYRVATLTGKSTIDYSGVRVWTERPPLPSQLGGVTPTPAPVVPAPAPAPAPAPSPAPTPTPTPTPTPSPSPTPSPNPTPTSGSLAPNNWAYWIYREGAGGKTILQPMVKSNSNGLAITLKSGNHKYQNTQYGYYCTVRASSSPQPKSITFTATYNAKNGNTVYFYADQSWNKLWQVSDTGGNNVTKTVTVNLGSQKEYCFGNVTIDDLNGGRFGSDRFLNVTNYKFNY